MHHILPYYKKHQGKFLKWYIRLGRLAKLPIAGALVRAVANAYARKQHSGFYITPSEVEEIIECAKDVALGPCTCRQVFSNCERPVMSELLVGVGREIFADEDSEKYRLISKAEAKKILEDCRRSGMINTIMQCHGDYYAICNCCTCCCAPYRLKYEYGIELALHKDKNAVKRFKEQLLKQ